jgi:hypothetical protein
MKIIILIVVAIPILVLFIGAGVLYFAPLGYQDDDGFHIDEGDRE